MIADSRLTHWCGCSKDGPCRIAAAYFRRKMYAALERHLAHTLELDGIAIGLYDRFPCFWHGVER